MGKEAEIAAYHFLIREWEDLSFPDFSIHNPSHDFDLTSPLANFHVKAREKQSTLPGFIIQGNHPIYLQKCLDNEIFIPVQKIAERTYEVNELVLINESKFQFEDPYANKLKKEGCKVLLSWKTN